MLPRFVHVDAGLDGAGGHYLGYAALLVAAAVANGQTPILVTPRGAGTALGFGAEVLPRLTLSPEENLAASGSEGQRPVLRLAVASLRAAERVWGRESMATWPGALRRLAGLAMVPAALVHAGRAREQRDEYEAAVALLTAELGQALASIDPALGPADTVVFPSATPVEVAAVSRLQRNLAGAPRWALVLRRDPDHEPGESRAVMRMRARRLVRAARTLPLSAYLFCDTASLVAAYSGLLGREVELAPIPVATAIPTASTQDFTFGYLGDARAEKGFALLPGVVAKSPKGCRFKLQSNSNGIDDPEVEAALAALAAHDNVELFAGPFSTEAYLAHLSDMDALLLPYDGRAYRRRSSGVFAEALAAGKPVIVSAGTWMAEVLQVMPGAGLTVARTPEAFAEGVAELLRHREHYVSTAQAIAPDWAERHSGERLFRALSGQDC